MTVSFDNPPQLAARGTVVVLPGRGEDATVYERLGLRLSFDAYRVRVLDDPTRDPAAVAAAVKAQLDLPAPHVLLGSDTGALFAALLVAEGTVTVDGLVLAGLPVTRRGEKPRTGKRNWKPAPPVPPTAPASPTTRRSTAAHCGPHRRRTGPTARTRRPFRCRCSVSTARTTHCPHWTTCAVGSPACRAVSWSASPAPRTTH